MKRLLTVLTAALVSTAAHAEHWYFVNMSSKVVRAEDICSLLPQGQTPQVSLEGQFGPGTVKLAMNAAIDHDQSRLQIFKHGFISYAFSDTTHGCLMTRAAIVEHIADGQPRQ